MFDYMVRLTHTLPNGEKQYSYEKVSNSDLDIDKIMSLFDSTDADYIELRIIGKDEEGE